MCASPTDVQPASTTRSTVAPILDRRSPSSSDRRLRVAAHPRGDLDRPDVVLPGRLRPGLLTLFATKVGLGLVFGLIFFALMWVNLMLTDRFGARDLSFEPEDEVVRRFQNAVRPYAGRIYAADRGGHGLHRGSQRVGPVADRGCSSCTASPSARTDPLFHKDIGFYIFTLPFVSFVVTWTLVSLFVILIVTVGPALLQRRHPRHARRRRASRRG